MPYQCCNGKHAHRHNCIIPKLFPQLTHEVSPPPQVVPATTRIRTRSMKNVEDERLLARLEYLRYHITRAHEWAEQKGDFKARVREIVNIENELEQRNITHTPVSRRDTCDASGTSTST